MENASSVQGVLNYVGQITVPESVKVTAGVGATLCAVALTASAIWGFAASCQQKWKMQSQLLTHRQDTQRYYELVNGLTTFTGASTIMLILLTNLGAKLAAGTLIVTCSGIALCVLSVVALNYVLSRQMSLHMEPKLNHSGLRF